VDVCVRLFWLANADEVIHDGSSADASWQLYRQLQPDCRQLLQSFHILGSLEAGDEINYLKVKVETGEDGTDKRPEQ
jgi:hypothetical protein